MRSFYRWAELSGLLAASPAALLDPVSRPRVLARPTPDVAPGSVLAAADDRTRLALKLAAYAGLGRAEIASLHTGTEHLIVLAGALQSAVAGISVVWGTTRLGRLRVVHLLEEAQSSVDALRLPTAERDMAQVVPPSPPPRSAACP